MITAKDVTLLQKHFVTKNEFNKKLSQVDTRFDRIDDRFDQMDRKIDQLLNTLDGFVGRVAAHDEEQIMLAHQQSETRDRLLVVETKLGISV